MKFNKYIEEKTERVKSISFHPTLPHCVIGLHTGNIRSYDLSMRLFVHEFTGHVGPVRCVTFHSTQPIFASCGDDLKIRIWDYGTRKIKVLLEGHLDYVRSVDFHPTQPYIISSSDDQTVKVWNFTSRELLATLTGHTHYVMCTKFFMDTYILSASLDQTIRIWDYKNINKKKSSFLGMPNVVLTQLLDSHEKGVNTLAVNGSRFASGGDDREVKLWEMDGVIAHEREAFYSHQSVLTSVHFHENLVMSTGEDGLLCMNEIKGKKCVDKTLSRFSIEGRIWCVAIKNNYVAIGHDTGLVFFNFKPVNPVFTMAGDKLIYLDNNCVLLENNLQKETPLFTPKKQVIGVQSISGYLLLQYCSHYEVMRNKSVMYSDKGIATLFKNFIVVVKEGLATITCLNTFDSRDLGSYSLVFNPNSEENNIYLYKNNQLVIMKDYEVIKKINCIVPVGIVKSNNLLVVYGTKEIMVYDNDYNVLNSKKEVMPILNGIIYNDTFYYSTAGQIKYLNPDAGVLKSISDCYLVKMDNGVLYFIRNNAVECVELDTTEIHFKKALMNGDPTVTEYIESGNLPGLSPVQFLLSSPNSNIAMPYVTDPKQRFYLCLKNNLLEDSLLIAEEQNDNALYLSLADVSLKCCDASIAEKVFLRLNDTQSLFFLYLCTKQKDKIIKLFENCDKKYKLGMAKYLKYDEYVYSLYGGSG